MTVLGWRLVACLVVATTWIAAGGDGVRAQSASPSDGASAGASDGASDHGRVDVEAAQAILAVQNQDGWLLTDSGSRNPIAKELVAPRTSVTRQWFYFIPAKGTPALLAHKNDLSAFEGVAGRKVPYVSQRDLERGLRAMLKGNKRIAMEYAPTSNIPSLTRVDDATVKLITGKLGLTVSSSAVLVQFTKSLWGPKGRVAHYVAMHHLTRLKDAALAYVAKELAAGRTLTELDVQAFLERGYQVRGIDGPPPVVAVGRNTADPSYVPSAVQFAAVTKDQLLLLDLSAKVTTGPRPIYARLSWVAYTGAEVPSEHTKMFHQVAAARDAAISFIEERLGKRRVVKGFEADRAARSLLRRAGMADTFLHQTGHSLDTSLYGDGANLDDLETHDTRNLVMGSGFTVGPGVYVRGSVGMRSISCVYIGRKGIEVTGPAQREVTALLVQ